MSKKYLVILVLPMIILFACSKSDSNYGNCVSTGGIPTSVEMASLETYITSKGITATKDSRGFYYEIENPGYGISAPTTSSAIQVKYKGTLTNGTVFDSTATGETRIFSLGGVVLGWQYGVPLIKKTGVINLYLPPSLGYGCTGSSSIPASSILIFHIELINY
jgi:FKBP-type peptidyl-prolyl cis-trans isomerase FkpA